jgi:hypothetical protein
MKNTHWKQVLMGGMVAALLSSCGADLSAVVAQGGTLPAPVEQPITVVGPQVQDAGESFPNDGAWNCTEQKYTAESAPEDMATFEPNPDVIWPGSLVQGATLESGAPEPIAVKRGGGTVLMNLVNAAPGVAAKSYQVHLTEMKQGNVIDAQNQILANNTGGTPAAFDFESTKVDSTEELAFAMNANVKWLSGSVDAKLSFTEDKRYSRYLVKLTQRYYTMVYETPTSLDEIFDPSVTAEQLAAYVRPGNPATYISSVTYGRQFYLLVESTSSAQDLKTSLDVAYKGFANATASEQSTYTTTSASMIVHSFAVGGGAQAAIDGALSAADGKLDKLHDFLVAGSTIDATNPGLPLSYEVRAVADNSLVKVGIATEFVRKTCIPVIPNDVTMALWLDAQKLSSAGAGIDPFAGALPFVTVWPGSSFRQNDGSGLGWIDKTGINGHQAVFLGFNQSLNSWDHFDVNLGGGAVVGTDYTVISVIRAAGGDLQSDPAYGQGLFMQGSNQDCTDCNLHLGFDTAGNLVHGHYYDDLRSQTRASTDGDVLTFRFSQAEGKTDSQNGAVVGTAPKELTALTRNDNSRIGGGNLSTGFVGYVGEVRVFSYAMNPLQQKTVECELGAKWSINVVGCVDGKPDPAQMQY